MQKNTTRRDALWIPVVKGIGIGIVLLIAFFAGFFFRDGFGVLAPDLALADPPESYDLLHEVHRLLDDHYLRELPEDTVLEYAAIRGFIGALEDPYTFFIDPPVARSESDVLAGQYGGIGVQIQHAADGRFVLYPFPDGPAAEAGIEAGDVLIAIDDWVIEPDARIDVIDQATRGEVGDDNGVTVRVIKHATGEERAYTIAFAVIEVPSVVWRQMVEDERIGYVQILRFTSRTPEELQRALQALIDQDIEAWVLDMRDNAGGLLQEAIETADEILNNGVILYETTRTEEKTYEAESGGIGIDLPLVIVVNHGTASAAELVAGALQDNGRGIVIGQRTYGKGSVQLIFPLVDGSSLHITAAEWFTPNRTPLDGNGLEPDISMIPAEDGRDVELDESLRYLQQQIQ
jgi:carboxyl-terminal processing protease